MPPVRPNAASFSLLRPKSTPTSRLAGEWEVLDMEHLYFVCPNTGRNIDAGIETDLETLLRIKTQTIEIDCPICRERHEWRVADAKLATAA
jgi:hypothetical protein